MLAKFQLMTHEVIPYVSVHSHMKPNIWSFCGPLSCHMMALQVLWASKVLLTAQHTQWNSQNLHVTIQYNYVHCSSSMS